jgi:hypothetical protein
VTIGGNADCRPVKPTMQWWPLPAMPVAGDVSDAVVAIMGNTMVDGNVVRAW